MSQILETTPEPPVELVDDLDAARDARHALRTRHSQSLSRLMAERGDLQGVHALADFVADSVRWTA